MKNASGVWIFQLQCLFESFRKCNIIKNPDVHFMRTFQVLYNNVFHDFEENLKTYRVSENPSTW